MPKITPLGRVFSVLLLPDCAKPVAVDSDDFDIDHIVAKAADIATEAYYTGLTRLEKLEKDQNTYYSRIAPPKGN